MKTLKECYKVPFRQVYCETLLLWVVSTIRCHVLYRLMPPKLPTIPCILAALCLLLGSAHAQLNVPVTSTNVLFPQSVPILLSTQTTNQTNGGLTNSAVLIQPGFGIGFGFSMTNLLDTVGTSNTTFGINVSGDGTNWPTTAPITFTKANNGATKVTFYTNMPAAWFDAARAVRLESIQIAATNSVGFTNVFFCRTRLQTRIP